MLYMVFYLVALTLASLSGIQLFQGLNELGAEGLQAASASIAMAFGIGIAYISYGYSCRRSCDNHKRLDDIHIHSTYALNRGCTAQTRKVCLKAVLHLPTFLLRSFQKSICKLANTFYYLI